MKFLMAFLIGGIFSIGLVLSGMTQPQKVISFLDVTGNWDPTLMFVLGGAVIVNFVGYRLVLRKKRPLLDPTFHLPGKQRITPALAIGAFIFGAGWGLAGYCPGPALVSLSTLQARPIVFVVCLLIGIYVFKVLNQLRPVER